MPETISAIKLRLNPDSETAGRLDDQSRKCNWLYNQLLQRANQLRDQYKAQPDDAIAQVLYTNHGLRNLVPGLKEENPFLRTVYSSPLKNTALRLTDCIQAYQKSRKGQRRGRTTGWPGFRAWRRKWFSLFYDEPGKGFRITQKALYLSLGTGEDLKRHTLKIPISDSSILKDKEIRSLRIVKQAGIFSAVLTVTRVLPEQKPIKRVIALDPNHKNFAYGVDSAGKAIEIERPWWLKRYEQRLDELKSLRDSKKKKSQFIETPHGKYFISSRRYQKINQTIERVLAKRREQTKVFMSTLANRLYQDYDFVGIGDYTPKGGGITPAMRRSMNNQSLIGRFKEVSQWTAQKSGKHFAEFDECGTTRTCHQCQYVVEGGLKPSQREWVCESCQTPHIRDENAAINGLRRILWDLSEKRSEDSGRVPGSGPVLVQAVQERWAWRVGPRGVYCTSRGTRSSSVSHRQEIKRKAWQPSIQTDQLCA